MTTDMLWYSVETPSFFAEARLPARIEDMTSAQERRFQRLERAAERHGTSITVTTYRRG